MSSSPETEALALDILRGRENPFDSLARPQRLDDNFLDLHVAELLAGERKLLLELIDSYRVEEYTRTADLRPTRVVSVLGDRGAGKTHLLQALAYRDDGKSQLLVRPSYYDVHLPFEEYLVAQLMATLAAEDEVYRSRPIEDIAAALTRRLLRQALRALGPTERFFALSPSRWKCFRLSLAGRADRECHVFDRLIHALESATTTPDLTDVVNRHGLAPGQCFRLIRGHLERHEAGPDLLAVLRRKLYVAMSQSALLRQNDALFSLLEGEYGGNGAASTRFETVARLLHVVTEVCALVRQPIVFAFDNLERLFSPQNQFDGDLVRAFFNSLAQAVDNTKGLLILLFAERGLFERAGSFMDEFARHRLEQGVSLFGRGPTKIIRLKPPAADEIRTLVKSRVRRLLGRCPDAGELPESFPFDNQALASAAGGEQTLRTTLVRLRDLYSAQVYEQPAAEQEPPPIHWEGLLESAWRDRFAAAGRELEGGPAGHLHKLRAGLGTLFQQVLPLSLDSWLLTQVQATASIGDHPTYGVVSLLSWEHQQDPNRNGGGLTMGVGFLLARGTGMPHDLRAKLDFFRRPVKGDRLVVFWPTSSDRDDLVEALPAATKAVWNESRHKNKVVLRRVGSHDLCTFLAVPGWLNAVQAASTSRIASASAPPFRTMTLTAFASSIRRNSSASNPSCARSTRKAARCGRFPSRSRWAGSPRFHDST
jgi:hypothetical protein